MTQGDLVSHLTDSSFENDVLKSQTPVLVDFWAPWCAPCRAVGPILEELAKEYKGKVNIAKLNIDENPKTAASYGVRTIPTLALFKGGKIIEQLIGLRPKESFEELLKKGL